VFCQTVGITVWQCVSAEQAPVPRAPIVAYIEGSAPPSIVTILTRVFTLHPQFDMFPVSTKLLKYKCKYPGISASMWLTAALEIVGIGSIIGRILTSNKDMTSRRCSTDKMLLKL
jgi:hypothetical protein